MRYIATAVVLALTLVACTGAEQRQEGDLAAALHAARDDPSKRLAAEVGCERAFSPRGGSSSFPAFAAGLLDVSESAATRAFCAGLIEAAISGDLSQEDLRAFRRPSEIRGNALLGNLLRAVVGAHERLSAQHAQVPPQALSCGCGQ
jgi:hypothetical protein